MRFHEPDLKDSVFGLPTFRYALAHHKPESFTALPPGEKKDSDYIIDHIYVSNTFSFFHINRISSEGEYRSDQVWRAEIDMILLSLIHTSLQLTLQYLHRRFQSIQCKNQDLLVKKMIIVSTNDPSTAVLVAP